MSKESAEKFIQAVLNDEELREKTANMKPEEVVPFAKEMGYDFTLEELKEVKKEDIELSPEELENAAGGHITSGTVLNWTERRALNAELHCYRNIRGPRHDWVKIKRKEEPIVGGLLTWLGDWTYGYTLCKCNRCGEQKWVGD